ncbi:MAG: ISL3 family transposase [Acidobacteriota bacterium]|nr:ISL3 family transposase [Acidobacteriota bacterium]
MKDFIRKFFKLEGYLIYRIWFEGHDVVIHVGRPKKEAWCPHCKSLTRRVHQVMKPQRVFHCIFLGRRVFLHLTKRRFRCSECDRVFTEAMPGVKKWARRSDLLWLMAFELLRHLSFRTCCDITGTSYSSLRRELCRVIKSGEIDWKEIYQQEEQMIIGIDEHSFRGQRMVTTITDIANHRLLAVLKDYRKETIKQFFRAIPPEIKEKIRELCGDMKWMYVKLAKEEIPQAKMVVDKFHLIRDANMKIDEARRIEQEATKKEIKRRIFLRNEEDLKDKEKEQLEEYFKLYPSLKEFYWVKEKLREMYRAKDRKEGKKILDMVIMSMRVSDDGEILCWRNMLRRWKDHILNYFDNRTTNAFTEGVHTKIKKIKRVSYGFRNVDVYVRKVALSFIPITLLPLTSHFLL